MSASLLRRFVILMVLFMAVVMVGTDFFQQWAHKPPGDYETEVGTLRLEDKLYDEAMAHYNKALELAPNHRGALMGRALVHIQTGKYQKAIAELTSLIAHLKQEVARDNDETDRGVLAAAYANRGIVHDRTGAYEKALADYIESLKTDEESVDGPGVVHKILYGSDRVSTVRDRAVYLHEQLQKPESERVLRIPELDDLQRMHRP
jgi:tetratricopeptide (TPR) repeat protein